MTYSRILVACLAVVMSAPALAAVPVEIEVAAVEGAPLDELQTWARVLGRMDLARVTLRGARDADRPTITPEDFGGIKRYKVLALLTRRNELQLPEGRFALSDSDRLGEYLHGLPDAMDEATIERGRFGLTADDFSLLLTALKKPAAGATAEALVGPWLEQTTAALPVPCEWSETARAALTSSEPLGFDWSSFSTGTALAGVLRSQGLALLPDQRRREPLQLRIVAHSPGVDWDTAWPVGWKPEGSPRAVVPAMYKVTTVEIANYTLAQALAALERPLGAQIVLDQVGIAAAKVDVAAVKVRVPRKKMLVKNAVDTCLSQGRLAGELRVDEAGKPFYWVTRFGPTSPRAAR